MLQQELLLTIAEISVTIAALSAVAGVVRQESFNRVTAGLLRDVAIIGMMVALFALIPLVLWSDGGSYLALRICAFAAASSWLCGYVLYLRRVLNDRSQITSAFWIGMLITLLGLVFLILCGSGMTDQPVTLYLLALLAWLGIAGLNFVASVFWMSPGDITPASAAHTADPAD